MSDLISRDYVLSEYDRQHKGPPGGARKIMEEAPAVDAVPVVHGRWSLLITEHNARRWQADASCSCCGFTKCNVWSGFFPDTPSEIARTTTQRYAEKVKLPNYCESCGAKMDLEVSE